MYVNAFTPYNNPAEVDTVTPIVLIRKQKQKEYATCPSLNNY